ncbi:hypothetical protein SAMN04488020_101316 [Palleronia marisminoris]|uniref:Uncharacterized protein n=1 Tax=Palleronia marisminoris TaxID=315423 RepID=A0A1Y5REC2_9RHOB|nr:hypothetical protein SAMN04488020_101316 [Palleronia marisminoris]SLN15485.1 hypothetical protein PAM7066_00317 [Palleronia marisminoris]
MRLLKWLVVGMTASMIALAIVLIWAILSEMGSPAPDWPAALDLPEGTRPAAVTRAQDFTVVVTEAGDILLFDAGGALTRRIDLK